jgi:crotonobetainyl-CoA:carnitine CoA-transferase CaiB-like acyl-CoA transferase
VPHQLRGAWLDVDGAQSRGSLHGLRVLDLSRVLAGPYCTQLLGDHGADVIKVEGPGGDETRGWGPPFTDDGTATYFYGINRNKRNLGLDLKRPRDREVVRRLLVDADVVVENFKAGTMAGWGLDHEALAARHPRLVYCRITGFGVDGPMGGLPGYDAALQAFGGLMSVNGDADGPALRVGVPIVDLVAANLAFSGILLALLERGVSDRGQLVDITLLDAVASILHPHAAGWLWSGAIPQRTGAIHPMVVPYQVFATDTGPFFVAAANDRQFLTLMTVLGHPELAAEPRYLTNPDRVTHRVALSAELARLIAPLDGDALMRELLLAGVPAMPVQDIGQALSAPQVAHRGLVIDRQDYRGVGLSIALQRTPGGVRTPPLARGADNREILAGLGYSGDALDDLDRR